MLSATLDCGATGKVEIFLEQREAAFLSPSKIISNLFDIYAI